MAVRNIDAEGGHLGEIVHQVVLTIVCLGLVAAGSVMALRHSAAPGRDNGDDAGKSPSTTAPTVVPPSGMVTIMTVLFLVDSELQADELRAALAAEGQVRAMVLEAPRPAIVAVAPPGWAARAFNEMAAQPDLTVDLRLASGLD